MKQKFLLLLTMLVVSVGGAWASSTIYKPNMTTGRVTTFEAGKKYFIYNTCGTDARYGYIMANSGCKKVTGSFPSVFSTNDNSYLWYVTYDSETYALTLQNVNTSKYYGLAGGANDNNPANINMYPWGNQTSSQAGVTSISDDGQTTTENASITFDDNKVFLIGKGTTFWNGNPGSWATWPTGHPFAFYEAAEETAYDITYRFLIDGNEVGTSTVSAAAGAAYPDITMPTGFNCSSDYYTLSEKPAGTVSKDETVDITVTQNTPFKISSSFSSPTWYTMQISAAANYLNYVAGDTNIGLTRTTTENDDKDLFCFVGNIFTGFKIYNKLAGDGYLLSSATPTTDKTWVYMVESATAETQAHLWDVTKSTSINGVDGFYLGIHCTTYRLNKQDSKLCYWLNGADAGSTFRITEVDLSVATQAQKDAAQTVLNMAGKVGYPKTSAATYTSLQTAIATENITIANLDLAVKAFKEETDVVLPENGKTYKLTMYSNSTTTDYPIALSGNSYTAKSTNTATVFYVHKFTNVNGEECFALITSAGHLLTSNGGSTSNYVTTYSNKTWPMNDMKIGAMTSISSNVSSSKADRFGYLYITGVTRSSSNVSLKGNWILKLSDTSWDSSEAPYDNASYTSCVKFEEVTGETVTTQELVSARVDALVEGYTKTWGTSKFGQSKATVAGTDYTTYSSYQSTINAATKANIEGRTFTLWAPAATDKYVLKSATGTYLKLLETDHNGQDDTNTSAASYSEIPSYFTISVVDNKYKFVAEDGHKLATCTWWRTWNVSNTDDNYWTIAEVSDDVYSISKSTGNYLGNSSTNSGDGIYTDQSSAINWSIIKAYPVVITSAQYATFAATEDTAIPEGVTAYYASSANQSNVILKPIEGGKIKGGQGVVLKKEGANGETYCFETTTGATDIEGNLLVGVTANKDYEEGHYILAKQGDVVGFAPWTSDGLAANKAYLSSISGGVAQFISFAFEEATGINEAVATEAQDGKFIENGQLVIVKGGVKYNVAGQVVK